MSTRNKGMTAAGLATGTLLLATSFVLVCAYMRRASKKKNKPRTAQSVQPSAKRGIATPAPHARVVFVLGGPGSGKGTQCALIAADEVLGYAHLSAGDLLRAERNSGSALAEMINEYIREGKIVPAEVTVRLLRTAMEKSGKSRFLIDGFPRNPENLAVWEASAADGSSVVDFALFLDCPEEIMTQRIVERGRSSGRIDDNEEAIRKRLVTYRESTMPIIKEFASRGKLKEVNSDQTIEEVAKDVRKHIDSVAWPRRQ